MARPDFFNDNANREFPFQEGTVGGTGTATDLSNLIDSAIVDCGFVMGPESEFDELTDSVYLESIERSTSDVFKFRFKATTAALADTPIDFYRELGDPDYTTNFVESDAPSYVPSGSASDSDSSSGSFTPGGECGEPYWSGYLVTGLLQDIADILPQGSAITRSGDDALVEKALIQNLNQSQVVSVNLANSDRTRAKTPEDCPDLTWPFTTGLVYPIEECLQGDIKFEPGYNIAIIQDVSTNTIQFFPLVGAGKGEPCTELPVFVGEEPPVGSTNGLLAGDYYCNEVFRTVNGIGGPNLDFYAGVGVSIVPDSTNNKVVIDINLADLVQCVSSISTVSVSESV